MKPRTVYAVDCEDFWCQYSLEYEANDRYPHLHLIRYPSRDMAQIRFHTKINIVRDAKCAKSGFRVSVLSVLLWNFVLKIDGAQQKNTLGSRKSSALWVFSRFTPSFFMFLGRFSERWTLFLGLTSVSLSSFFSISNRNWVWRIARAFPMFYFHHVLAILPHKISMHDYQNWTGRWPSKYYSDFRTAPFSNRPLSNWVGRTTWAQWRSMLRRWDFFHELRQQSRSSFQ